MTETGGSPGSPDDPTRTADAQPTKTARPSAASDREPGHPSAIGRYRILAKLGEGGMGVVYEAEQKSPRRRVAVKVVRGGRFVDEHQVRLFQREADTLARLAHPNIGSIYESGRTEDGRHFFAMELVRGETLDVYLRKRRAESLTGEELRFRLSLFRKIAEAVHYAHQRGVIHRDLKPSNIIVTEASARGDRSRARTFSEPRLPEVKILDFGLARITDGDVAAATMTTEIGVIKGTLAYMSPEQARGNPAEIDLRSDVYALGVILYEMLTGRRPYDVSRKSLAEAVRVICTESPQPLRQTLSGAAQLDADVGTIVAKALEKEVERRYTGAAALSEDISRYLASQPILARPPSTIYQLRKFAARNRALVGGVVATILVLVAGIVASTVFGLREAKQRRRAEASHLFALGHNLLEEHPSLALGYVIASLERADHPDVRRFAMELLWRGPTAFSDDIREDALSLAYSPDGRWLAGGGWQGLQRVWRQDGSPPIVLDGHGADERVGVWFGARSDRLFTRSDKSIRIWELPTARELRRLDAAEIAFDGATSWGDRLLGWTRLAGGERFQLQWFPLGDGRPTDIGVWEPPQGLADWTVDPRGEWLAYAVGPDLWVLPLEGLEGEVPRLVGRSAESIRLVVVHPDRERIATCNRSQLIELWSLEGDPSHPLRSFQGPGNIINGLIRFDPAGSRMVAVDGMDEKATFVWDLAAPQGAEPMVLRRGTEIDAVFALAVHPAGSWLAVADTNTVSLWPLSRSYGQVLQRLKQPIEDVVFDPAGEWLASTAWDGAVRLWQLDAAAPAAPRILFERGMPATSLSVAADGERLVASFFDGRVVVLPLAGGTPTELTGFGSQLFRPVFDREGRRVAAAAGMALADDAVIRVWDLESGEVQSLDRGDGKAFIWVEFTADGRLLSSGRGGLRLWDLETGESRLLAGGSVWCKQDPGGKRSLCAREREPSDGAAAIGGPAFVIDLERGVKQDLLRHGDAVLGTAWHPSGEYVATASADGAIRVGPVSGEQPHLLMGHEGPVRGLAFHPDGTRIASAGNDGTLRLWPVPRGRPLHQLPLDELLDRLRALTNYRAVRDDASIAGYRLELEPLAGWEKLPTW